mmetsp:Transcript_63067/g.150465  ORF Transcript_63067/g.150465 Transcript_63067/m.150465 type:complete len:281 (+) Transcript_63067:664-1506(+)
MAARTPRRGGQPGIRARFSAHLLREDIHLLLLHGEGYEGEEPGRDRGVRGADESAHQPDRRPGVRGVPRQVRHSHRRVQAPRAVVPDPGNGARLPRVAPAGPCPLRVGPAHPVRDPRRGALHLGDRAGASLGEDPAPDQRPLPRPLRYGGCAREVRGVAAKHQGPSEGAGPLWRPRVVQGASGRARAAVGRPPAARGRRRAARQGLWGGADGVGCGGAVGETPPAPARRPHLRRCPGRRRAAAQPAPPRLLHRGQPLRMHDPRQPQVRAARLPAPLAVDG